MLFRLSLTVQFSAANVLSNAKVLVDKEEFATYDFKLERGQDPNGKFTVSLRKQLSTRFSFSYVTHFIDSPNSLW